MIERQHLQHAIAALEAQRAALGDAVVDAGLAPMKAMLAQLDADSPSEAPAEQRAKRRQVSVLFADISGFTRMSEAADAEDVAEAVNALWEAVDRTIVQRDGTIDKHMGDAVMALWGAGSAHEDDPEQAVRAALALQQTVRDLGLTVGGRAVQVRVGVHTGPVFLGQVGTTGEYTAMGDTVNVASRLQRTAQVGAVIISHDTYQHVRGAFDVRALPPLIVEGKAEPLRAYAVQQAKPRAFRMSSRGVEGIETRMVGRAFELRYLQDALSKILQNAERQLVTVVAEAGIGKSRLLYEFENWVELLPELIRYFKGRANPEMQNVPYALLRDMLASRFQIQENDPPQIVRSKIEAGVAEVMGTQPEAHMQAHFIGQLLGFDLGTSPFLQGVDARQLRDRALGYMVAFFRATTARWPTVVFLEDIHWADGSSLAAVEALAQSISDQPLLIICLARPTLFERYPHWNGERLELKPLSRDDSRQLVGDILQRAGAVPVALRELVVSGAEGNPYYLEEFIKMLIEDGVIVKGDRQWHIVPERLVQARVPGTLVGLLQARLDSLPSAQRAVLQQASVIGRVFWDSAVSHLNPESGTEPANLGPALQALCDCEMIFPQPSSAFAGTQEYMFKHAILREVAYESVLKRERRAYHARAAGWLSVHSGERAGEFTGVIADHLALAGQAEEAVHYLVQAGRRAAQQFANAEAVHCFSRALDLWPAHQTAGRYETLLARERVYDLQGLREAQLEDLAALRTLAETWIDHPQHSAARQAEIALRCANYSEMTGNYSLAIVSARTAVEQARLAGDVAREAEGHLLWGRALWRQGNLAESLPQNRQALALSRSNDLKRIEAQALRTLGAISFHQGDYSQVQAPYERALQLYREIGDRRGIGSCLNNLGDIARQQGDYAGARNYFEQSIRNSREIGERWSEVVGLGNLALVLHNLGDQEAARNRAAQSLALAREIGYRSGEVTAYMVLAHTVAALGNLEEAETLYCQAIDLLQELGIAPYVMESRAGLAGVYLAQGDMARALEQVQAILAHLENGSLGGAEEPFRIYLTCYEVLRACGDSRAAQVLDTAYQLLERQAARIDDDVLRRSFLENVRAHAQIVRAWSEAQPRAPAE